jgi:hypothetical protein
MSPTPSLIASLTSVAGLRRVLWADAASGSAMGLLHLGAPALLADLLGVSPTLLTASGWLLLPFVVLAGWQALQRQPSRGALTLLVVGNFAWVAGSAAVVFGTGLVSGAPGMAYVGVQALAVLVLAELQWMALRRRAAPLQAC